MGMRILAGVPGAPALSRVPGIALAETGSDANAAWSADGVAGVAVLRSTNAIAAITKTSRNGKKRLRHRTSDEYFTAADGKQTIHHSVRSSKKRRGRRTECTSVAGRSLPRNQSRLAS
jgi:hypothetical protein